MLVHQLHNALVVNVVGVKGFNGDGSGFGHADGVGHQHLQPVGQASRHQVFGDIAGGVGAGAVNFGGVFAGEGATAVPGNAAVGIHQNLAPGQAGVPLRPADHKPAAGVDKILGLVVQQLRRHDGPDDLLNHIPADLGAESVPVGSVVMLAADDDSVNAIGFPVAVFHRDLRLAVRPQVGQRAILADGGQPLHQPVRKVNGDGHQAVGFVAGETHHHPLVAGAGSPAGVRGGAATAVGAMLQRRADAGVDVRRLLAGVADDAAGMAVDAVLQIGVADFQQRLPGEGIKVQVRLRGDFAGNHHQVFAGHGLAGHAAHRINGQGGVQHGVRNLVANLVGVAFGNRLGGEQVLGRGVELYGHWGCSSGGNFRQVRFSGLPGK